MKKNLRVAVCHPLKQHSHQLAFGLAKSGILSVYISGSPVLKKHQQWVSFFLGGKSLRTINGFPEEHVWWVPAGVIFYFLAGKISNKTIKSFFTFAGNWFSDFIYSLVIPWNEIDMVVGYEEACRSVFLRAKKMGKITVLDAASLHYQAQDKYFTGYAEPDFLHTIKNKIKKMELSLTDHVITLTTLAQEGYVESGVPFEKTSVLHLGVDIEIFKPKMHAANFWSEKKTFDFVFCGNFFVRKGLDILIESFRIVSEEHPEAYLSVIGDCGELSEALANGKNIKILGKKSQKEIAAIYQDTDCFVLPSRHDSCSMAVLEAMACGLPVILSDQNGAKDFVVDSKNGWVVKVADVDELANRMLCCIKDKGKLHEMRPLCRETAESHTWERYYADATNLICRVSSLLEVRENDNKKSA
ncbi:MAG TPA: glycosyltransferase family 4 protein [Candidatus Omnitrophota bacterium]|nr:glycosyltransferase family 4 protein [Candidatus Omnitrophota bacterium]